jgi:hypothetical protein
VDKAPDKLWTRWDGDGKRFFMQMQFKVGIKACHGLSEIVSVSIRVSSIED